MAGSNLKFVHKGVYEMPTKADVFDAIKQRPDDGGKWSIARKRWLHNPKCITLLVRFWVVGNDRLPAP
eukprot:scaffold1484_cov173-Amphora_coffeaeformis.AAC.23